MIKKNCKHCGERFETRRGCQAYCCQDCFKESRIIPTGTRFGRWTVADFAQPPTGKYEYKYKCVCDCGKIGFPRAQFLKDGRSQSCGCLHNEQLSQMMLKHGHSKRTAEYQAFQNAKSRCTNTKLAAWPDYGGRGIRFLFNSFEEFFAALGPRPAPEYTVDRRNNDGHYEPGNVRWATRQEQRSNQRPRAC